MQMILVTLCTFLLIAGSAVGADSGMRLSLHVETLENGDATSLGINFGEEILYGGLSLNYIPSSKVIQYSRRQTIYPLYLFFGLKALWKYAPYVEAGFDIGDALIDDLYDFGDEEVDLVHYYSSGGILFPLNDKVSLSIFAKKYNFIYRETLYPPT